LTTYQNTQFIFVNSPRYNNAANRFDGGSIGFAYSQNQVGSIYSYGFMNPTPPDGTNTALQPNLSSSPMTYNTETLAVQAPQQLASSDTYGHQTVYALDSQGRVTSTRVYTGTQWLTSTQQWSTDNQLIASTDARGNETDYAYDANGNNIAVGYPAVTVMTATGLATIRPTTLLDYDGYNNLVAYCDPAQTHAANGDWSSPSSLDNLCSSHATNISHLQAAYTFPSYEPYGELQTVILPATASAPGGYHETVTYDPSLQGGTDHGLPTSIVGDVVQQSDGTSRTPGRYFWYNASGWVGCYGSGPGKSVVAYDGLGRITAVSDPDDSSMTGTCSKIGQPSWNTVNSTVYNPDGTIASTQSPSERAAGVSTSFTYDADRDLLSKTTHHGCSSASACTPGVTQYWYDGADRLIETSMPQDTSNPNDIPWLTRNIYDLASGGSATSRAGIAVTAHGGLFETQKSSPGGWIDTGVMAYDALDRRVTDYGFAPCPSGTAAGALYCTSASYANQFTWDGGSALGLLTSTKDGLNQTRSYAYDAFGRATAIQYAGDNGVTPAMSYVYDPNGRMAQSTAGTIGAETYSYDVRGDLSSVLEPATLGAGTTSYARYGDSMLSSMSVSHPLMHQTNMLSYAYRADGLVQQEQVTYGPNATTLAYAYTKAGRVTQATDFGSTPSHSTSYDTFGRVQSYSIPAGTYASLTYDAEGDVTSYSGYNGESVSQTYNLRGNLVAESFVPNPVSGGFTAWPAFRYQNIQGVTVQSTSQEWDGRTGAILGASTTYDPIGRVTAFNGSSFSYDAENRFISGGTDSVTLTGNCGSGLAPRTTLEGYVSKYVYGPDGRVAQSVSYDPFRGGVGSTRSWHWNGGSLLYTDNGSNVEQAVADDVGVIPAAGAAPGLTVVDEDPNGFEASRHNSTGYGAWFAPNPMGQKCVSQSPGASSPGFVDVTTPFTIPSTAIIDDGTNAMDGTGRQSLPAAVTSLTPNVHSQYDARKPLDDCPQPVATDGRHRHTMEDCGNGGGSGPGALEPTVPAPTLSEIGRVWAHPAPSGPDPGNGSYGDYGVGGGWNGEWGAPRGPLPHIGGVVKHYPKPTPLQRFWTFLITFNRTHAFRPGRPQPFLELDPGKIEEAIRAQLEGYGSFGDHTGFVEVDGMTIEYRAFLLPDGTVNIGTYFPTDGALSNGELPVGEPPVIPEVIVP
jgi:YD repeat-containing protein